MFVPPSSRLPDTLRLTQIRRRGNINSKQPTRGAFISRRKVCICHECTTHSELTIFSLSSYDNKVKLFDTRSSFIPLTEIDVGGGAWRVKWHPCSTRRNDLLVACMHDGFKVISFTLDHDNVHGEILKRFDAHESIAYGADWSFSPSEDDETLIATCSFYDHKLHLWSG
jgi:diphthine methyl ester acylhydrolase